MKRIFSTLFILFLFAGIVSAQKYTISGFIKDVSTGEVLIGASVYVPKLKIGTVTNTYGFYSITLDADSIGLIIRYLGYKPVLKKIDLHKNLELNISLSTLGNNEVVITGPKAKDNI